DNRAVGCIVEQRPYFNVRINQFQTVPERRNGDEDTVVLDKAVDEFALQAVVSSSILKKDFRTEGVVATVRLVSTVIVIPEDILECNDHLTAAGSPVIFVLDA